MIPLFYTKTCLFIIDFKRKAEILNSLFVNQCTPINNYSKLLLELEKKTQNALSTINFISNDIEKIIKTSTQIKRIEMTTSVFAC